MVCTKRGGVGDEREKRDREKGREPLQSLPISPTPAPPFSLPPISTTFDPCYAGYKQSFVLARLYMLARGWHVLRQTDWETGRHIAGGSEGRVADGVLVSPLHSQTNFASETFFRLDKNNWLLDARFTFLNIILTLYFRWLFLEFGSSQQ